MKRSGIDAVSGRAGRQALFMGCRVACGMDLVPFARRRPWWRRRRTAVLALVAIALLILPAAYSYTTTMMKPSSLPLWPRSVEWLRAHHGNWLVDEVEHY